MKTCIAIAIFFALFVPGLWLESYFTKIYGNIDQAPIMGQLIAILLFVLPWYVIFGNGGKYITAIARLFGLDKDE